MNNSVIIPVDKKLSNYSNLLSIFQPVIEHWKISYKFVDISKASFKRSLADCGLVLLIQPGVGRRLKKEDLRCIEGALKKDSGLFVADPSFLKNKHLAEFDFSKNFPTFSSEVKTHKLKVADNKHFVSNTKEKDEVINLPVDIKVSLIRTSKKSGKTLLTCRGKKVIFFQSPRIGFSLISPESIISSLGFGTDLDVFYWKSIVYLARKPFVQLLPPRFLTLRIEDVIGEGDYEYLDFIVKQGFKVHLGVDLTDFDKSLSKKLLKYRKQKQVEYSPHAFSHFKRSPLDQTHLIYIRFDGKEYTDRTIKKNFRKLNKFEEETGIRFSSVLTNHYCQLGRNALPELKKKGITYLAFPFRTNVRLDEVMKKPWRMYPFGKLGMVSDYLPEDKDFFVVNSLDFPHKKPKGKGKMNVRITSNLDFLYGLRLKEEGKSFSQYDEATERAYRHVRRSFENMFFSSLLTHETLINYLKLKEFKKLISQIKDALKPLDAQGAQYGDIAKYYRDRFRTQIKGCTVKNRVVSCNLSGEKGKDLHIALYTEGAKGIKMSQKKIRTKGGTETIKLT